MQTLTHTLQIMYVHPISDSDSNSDLDHFLIGPKDVYTDEESDSGNNQGTSDSDTDPDMELDPEPSSGPVDPG